jgi:hypothetical protein
MVMLMVWYGYVYLNYVLYGGHVYLASLDRENKEK